jgi:hypothetical protein
MLIRIEEIFERCIFYIRQSNKPSCEDVIQQLRLLHRTHMQEFGVLSNQYDQAVRDFEHNSLAAYREVVQEYEHAIAALSDRANREPSSVTADELAQTTVRFTKQVQDCALEQLANKQTFIDRCRQDFRQDCARIRAKFLHDANEVLRIAASVDSTLESLKKPLPQRN